MCGMGKRDAMDSYPGEVLDIACCRAIAEGAAVEVRSVSATLDDLRNVR